MRVKAQVLLEGYHHRWLDEGLVPLRVEAEFQCPLVNPATGAPSKLYRLGGKLDVIARLRDGSHRHRRAQVLRRRRLDRLDVLDPPRMDGQVSTYFDGAAALGLPADTCLYDVIGKPTQRPAAVPLLDEAGAKIVLDSGGQRVRTKDGKKWRETGDAAQGFVLQTRPETPEEYRDRLRAVVAEDPDRYYARGEVVRLEEELFGHRQDMWALAVQLRDHRQLHQPRNPDACVAYGSTCEFFDCCSGAASLDDAARFVRLEDVHPELTTAAPSGA
jgi:hypothetical protein